MTQRLKFKHLLRLFAVVIIFILLFLQIYFFQWFIPSLNSLIAASMLATFCSISFFYLFLRNSNESLIFKLGHFGTSGIFTFFAILGLLALLTNLLGNSHDVKGSVVAYYWSTGNCGYMLKLNELTPIGGGFCNAGKNQERFNNVNFVDMKVKESILGTLVLNIEPALANPLFTQPK